MTSSVVIEDDDNCFICGSKNEHGMKLKWVIKDKETAADFVPDKKFQGWKNLVHGGILCALLDEAMTRLVGKLHGPSVTAEMTVRFLAPAVIGQKLKVEGRIVDDTKRLVIAQAQVSKEDGNPVCRAESRVLILKT